jgi:hypothetical protein
MRDVNILVQMDVLGGFGLFRIGGGPGMDK